MFVSGVQQSDSAIHVLYVSIFFLKILFILTLSNLDGVKKKSLGKGYFKHVNTRKAYLAPLMRPTKFPEIPVSLERNTEVFRHPLL